MTLQWILKGLKIIIKNVTATREAPKIIAQCY